MTDAAAAGLKSDFNFLEYFDTFKDSTGNDAGGKICYAIVCYIHNLQIWLSYMYLTK